MCVSTKVLGSLLFAVCATLPATAQGGGIRRVTFARVVDRDGEPVAGAVVTFAGGMPHLGSEAADDDVQVVASDQRGRAQAKLEPGFCYVVWAVGPSGAGGACVMSSPVGYFGAGSVLELRCDQTTMPRRMACEGAEAWADLGPLRFFAMTPSPGSEVELSAEVDGTLSLPPGPYTQIEARTKGGAPLWSMAAGSERFVIPPPRHVPVRAVDENGVPLAGVVLRHRVARRSLWQIDSFGGGITAGRFRELGVTPANGRIEVIVPYPSEPLVAQSAQELLMFACAPGRPAVAGGVFNRSLYQNDARVNAFKGDELEFRCRSVEPLRGSCGAVPEGTVAHLAGSCKLFGQGASYTFDVRSFTTPVQPDGTFVFVDVPEQLHSCRLTIVTPEGSQRQMPWFRAHVDRELPAEVAVRAGQKSPPPVLLDAATLQLRVTDADGGPARGVVAYLAPADISGVMLRESVIRFPLDAAGRAEPVVLPGEWALLVVSRIGYGAARLEVTAGAHEQSLSLVPLARMQIRLLDNEGKPIAGAHPIAVKSRTRASGDPVEAMLQSHASGQRSVWPSLSTDAQGQLSITFLPANGIENVLKLTWSGGSTDPFLLQANDSPTELRPKQ